MKVLAKKKNGNCIFLDDKNKKCTIYKKRPLECKIYPFLLDFSGKKPDVKLDTRFCPNLLSLSAKKEKILKLIQSQNFQKDWISAYKDLGDFGIIEKLVTTSDKF
jgi:Fe-S-cluster containining protein